MMAKKETKKKENSLYFIEKRPLFLIALLFGILDIPYIIDKTAINES